MSYSLLSTKRKFHRLLDSLADSRYNGAQDSNDSSFATDAITADRRATKRLKPIAKQHSRLVSADPKLSSLLNQQTTERGTDSFTKIGSRLLLQGDAAERVARLPPVSWNPSDKSIDAPDFAKWGWKLVAKETVECVSCHRRFVVLPDDLPEDSISRTSIDWTSEEFVKTTTPRLRDEHDEDCMWTVKHCSDSVWTVQLYPARGSLEKLHSRYAKNAQHTTRLPPVIRTPDALRYGDKDLEAVWSAYSKIWPPSHETPVSTGDDAASSHDSHQRAFALALLGWEAVPLGTGQSVHDVIFKCGHCFARFGLWQYVGRPGMDVLLSSLHIADQHVMECPWVSAESQCGGLALHEYDQPRAAWEVLCEMVFSAAGRADRKVQDSDFAAVSSRTARNGTGNETLADSENVGQKLIQAQDGERLFYVLNGEQEGEHEGEEEARIAPAAGLTNRAPTTTDEERRREHKLNMAWLKRFKLGKKVT